MPIKTKVHYLSVLGRKVAAVVEEVDLNGRRLLLRVTATKDQTYRRGELISCSTNWAIPR